MGEVYGREGGREREREGWVGVKEEGRVKYMGGREGRGGRGGGEGGRLIDQ